LFALRTLAKAESGSLPEIFTDPSYANINQVFFTNILYFLKVAGFL
jgi:hypothetical protein